jgi:CubicO group peptidase (beta-lactamase class C family)
VSFLAAASLLLLLSHPPTSTPPQKELTRAIDASVTPYVEYHAFSGVVLLARGDSVLAERSYGMANYELGIPNRTDTRFRIASITKWFMLIVVTRLADEKKISRARPRFRSSFLARRSFRKELVGRVGLEPTTTGLKGRCSTD